MRLRIGMIGLALLAFAGAAPAQDGGNLAAALDHGVANLDATVRTLLQGDVGSTTVNLNETVGTLLVDLSDGTPLDRLANAGVGLGNRLTDTALMFTPVLDQLAAPVAELAAPLSQVYLSSGVLRNGLPLVNGENIVLLIDGGLLDNLTGQAIPVRVLRDLAEADVVGPGDSDGGGALVLGLLDGQGGIQVPFTGGGLLGGGLMLGNGNAMARSEIPLVGALDAGTLTALTNGVRLPGL